MLALNLIDVPLDMVPAEARLPVCSTPASFPFPAQDDMEEPIDLTARLIDHPAASYVLRVLGHSMTGAGAADGDLVVVSRAVEARPGDIVVALVHGDRTMKRLRRRGQRLRLLPEAKGFDAILVDEIRTSSKILVGTSDAHALDRPANFSYTCGNIDGRG